MSKRRTGEQGIGGLDSFQDIVANLVGILIILVIVVMMRARDALVEQPELPEITKVTQQQVKDAEHRPQGPAMARRVDAAEFAAVLGRILPANDRMTRSTWQGAFETFCEPESNTVDLQNFAAILAIFNSRVSTVEKLRLAFQAYDSKHRGRILLDDLEGRSQRLRVHKRHQQAH